MGYVAVTYVIEKESFDPETKEYNNELDSAEVHVSDLDMMKEEVHTLFTSPTRRTYTLTNAHTRSQTLTNAHTLIHAHTHTLTHAHTRSHTPTHAHTSMHAHARA
jgi:hypothetical protein